MGTGRVAGILLVICVASGLPAVHASEQASTAPFPGAVNLVPQGTVSVGNCIPFGTNTRFGFTGFIYRDVPAFRLAAGSRIAFDLGREADVDVRRNIYLSATSVNPTAPTGLSQGVQAVEWTQVVSDTQLPATPRGNAVIGDYELMYEVTGDFDFPGGGLAVGIGASPPGEYADSGCAHVLVHTSASDPSGHFYGRFWSRSHLTTDVLDAGLSWGTTMIGGMVVFGVDDAAVTVVDVEVLIPVPAGGRAGVAPIGVFSSSQVDATSLAAGSMRFGSTGAEDSVRACVTRDLNGNGLDDLFCRVDLGVAAVAADGLVRLEAIGPAGEVVRGQATVGWAGRP